MLVILPKSELHPQTRLTVSHPEGETVSIYDDSFKEVEVALPEGVNEDDVEVVAHYCNINGEPDLLMVGVLVKGKVHRDPNSNLSNPASEQGPSVDDDSPVVDPVKDHAEDAGPVGEADLKQEEPATKEEVVDDEAMLAAWAAEEAAKHQPE